MRYKIIVHYHDGWIEEIPCDQSSTTLHQAFLDGVAHVAKRVANVKVWSIKPMKENHADTGNQ